MKHVCVCPNLTDWYCMFEMYKENVCASDFCLGELSASYTYFVEQLILVKKGFEMVE